MGSSTRSSLARIRTGKSGSACSLSWSGGLGEVPFFVDVIFRPRNELVRTTEVQQLRFRDREMVVQMSLEIQGCPFPEPGLYLLELYCDNVCVADVPLRLLEGEENHEQEPSAGQ